MSSATNDASELSVTLKGITHFLKQHQESIKDKDDLRRILFRTESLLGSLTDPEKDDLAHEVERRTDLKSKLDTILATLELGLHPQLSDLPTNPDQSQKITTLMDDIRYCLADYQTSLQHAIYDRDHQSMDPDDLGVLNKLTHANDVDHLSGNIRRCLRGTRTGILRGIEGWAEDRNNVRVYWLNGVAGCGKTTIARTFADYAFAEGSLGACFFCSRSVADRSDLKFIFPTLAFELAHRSRDFRSRLVQVIKSSPNVAHDSLSDQLEKLIIQPLRSTRLRTIIIIDALDECKDDEPASVILSLLARHIEEIPSVKFFITGRPEPRIRSGFRLPLLRPYTDVFVLHKVDPTSVNHDIKKFFRSCLFEVAASRNIRDEVLPWLTEHNVDALVRKSGGLFIYAETILKLVAADDSPVDRLQTIVTMPDSTTDEGTSGLDGLYNQIIQESSSSGVSDSFLERLRIVLATVVLVFNPLSRTSLATLLNVGSNTILASLRSLHSVILVPDSNSDPICTFHKSFPDYLTDPSRCTDARFYTSSGVYHAKVTILCLELMRSRLRKNICDLPQYVMNKDVHDLHTRRRKFIGDALEYACRFWARHLMLSYDTDKDNIGHILELLDDIVQHHLLTWLEVLSISEDMRSAVYSLLDVEQWLMNVTASHLDLLNSIHECRRFVLHSFDGIKASAPHIYDSVLIWTPTSSLVRTLYHDQLRTDTKVLNAIGTSWDACVRSMKFSADEVVKSVAFSHKGNLIASGGSRGGMPIYEFATGACIAMLNGHTESVNSVAFSPDDMLLVSGSDDNTVRVWDVQTGALIITFEGHGRWVESVAFSPSGTMVASCAGYSTVRIWNVSSGRCEREFNANMVASVCWLGSNIILWGSAHGTITMWDISGETSPKMFEHTYQIRSIISSRDASKFAFSSGEKIKIYDSRTGTILQSISAVDWVESVSFSPDGDKIAYGLRKESLSVVVWDLVEKVAILKSQGGGGRTSVAFAPDGRYVVSGSEDGLKIWHIGSRDRDGDDPDQHSKVVTCVSLAMDRQLIASGSLYHTVELWDATTGSRVYVFIGHYDSITSIAFSPDSSIVASGSRDATIRIWSVDNHNQSRTLKGRLRSVHCISFSPDGKSIVSLSDGGIIVWNVEGGEKLAVLRIKGLLNDPLVSFSADGTRIIMTTESGDIQGWDVVRGQEPLGMKERRPRMEALSRLLKRTRAYPYLRPVEGNLITHNMLPQFHHYQKHGEWVMDWQDMRVCWIPPDFRTAFSDIQGKTVVLWPRSGRFVVVDVSDMPSS